MLTAHDQIAIAKLRRRLAAGNPAPSVAVAFERLARVADRFSASPSVSSVWREMEFVVARCEQQQQQNGAPF